MLDDLDYPRCSVAVPTPKKSSSVRLLQLKFLAIFGSLWTSCKNAASGSNHKVSAHHTHKKSRYLVCPSHSHTQFGAANGTSRGPFCAIPDNWWVVRPALSLDPKFGNSRKNRTRTNKGPNRLSHPPLFRFNETFKVFCQKWLWG